MQIQTGVILNFQITQCLLSDMTQIRTIWGPHGWYAVMWVTGEGTLNPKSDLGHKLRYKEPHLRDVLSGPNAVTSFTSFTDASNAFTRNSNNYVICSPQLNNSAHYLPTHRNL